MFWVNKAHASSSIMPPQASNFAGPVDSLYDFLYWSSLISCILVIGGLVFFAFKYKRKTANDSTAYISHNATLEFLWSFIPFVIFLAVFAWGWKIFYDMKRAPKNAFEIHVVGQKWYWDFKYKSGKKTTGTFKVPYNKPIKLIMTSRDVLHSFYVPAFRIKQDVIPGRYTTLWFTATKLGTYQMFCTEYCGSGHSAMLAKVEVVPEAEFEEWLSDDPYKGLSMAEVGQKVFTQRCIACHNNTAEKKIGPGFKGLYGKERLIVAGTTLKDGKPMTVKADDNYLRESILNPNAKKAKGYENAVMTSFQGQLSDNELDGIIEYIKQLK